MQAYPKWKFASGDRGVIVENAAEEARLGEGWYDSPTLIPEVSAEATPVEDAPEPVDEAVARRRGRPRKVQS